ncbi:MAG: aminotransferase class V-fold PLP-dependent enzyme [Hyphomicrobiales bacterium]|nr:aminotransferase class V-fold PLP-dependent enzyme [Hyphomicrobiales bacterium]
MNLQSKYALNKIINARGAFTPLGVSRSSAYVAEITGEALKHYFDIDELQTRAGQIIASHCGAEFATITNCASAAITLSIAATMTGMDHQKIASLPDTSGMNSKVVIAASHNVNYGHLIEQDIRLAGCTPIFVGDHTGCTIDQINSALAQPGITAILYVESRMTSGEVPVLENVVTAAHAKKIPIIIDGAAQDMRMGELVSSGADLLVFSAQKYLAAPTAGIVVGHKSMVEAVHAQIYGIGRPMKAAKETILGTIAAIEERGQMDMDDWSKIKQHEAIRFAEELEKLENINTTLVKDPSKGEFWRIDMKIEENAAGIGAAEIADRLQRDSPVIFCLDTRKDEGILNFEVLNLDIEDRQIIIKRIEQIMDQVKNSCQ